MKIYYDFHIHSSLSPCADDGATPCNIVAMASVKGLDAICISDHNAIENVEAAIRLGECFDVTVMPAVEVQTAEDIHVLAVFPSFEKLKAFFDTLSFPNWKNDPESLGNQLIVNEDDEIVGSVDRMLLVGSEAGVYEVCERIISGGGKAILAHIDREANGILAILGCIPEDLPFSAIEFSHHATEKQKEEYSEFFRLTDSDAHRLDDISEKKYFIEAPSKAPFDIFSAIGNRPL